MHITKLTLKNFRCFSHLQLEFTTNTVLIEGDNGTGKTSVLEALHYLCYLRSFRTYIPSELIQFGQDSFFIKGEFVTNDQQPYEIQVGFGDKQKIVKVNQKSINSYKELLDFYRVVTLTEDDLYLIKASPDVRRSFIDQIIMIYKPETMHNFKTIKSILDNRTALIKKGAVTNESFMLWTEQLWNITQTIQQERMCLLQLLEQEVAQIIHTYFDASFAIKFSYKMKKNIEESYEQFFHKNKDLWVQEVRFGRSLFGAHLDDFVITFQDKKSKSFSSRGQQKLTVLLMKIAQLNMLVRLNFPTLFLLDDFMTDFDQTRVDYLLKILSDIPVQRIFTAPKAGGYLEQSLLSWGGQKSLLDVSY